MTKMVCTAAALQQVERGNLELAAPVDTYCPEFADLPVLEGFDGDTPKLRPPGSRATVSNWSRTPPGWATFWNEELVRWESVTGTPDVLSGSAEAFKAPAGRLRCEIVCGGVAPRGRTSRSSSVRWPIRRPTGTL